MASVDILLLSREHHHKVFTASVDIDKRLKLLIKDANLVSEQIQATIRRETGLVMHVHLFRHLAGKLSLRMDPGNYEQVRRLLGHRTIDTTTIFYTGFATEVT